MVRVYMHMSNTIMIFPQNHCLCKPLGQLPLRLSYVISLQSQNKLLNCFGSMAPLCGKGNQSVFQSRHWLGLAVAYTSYTWCHLYLLQVKRSSNYSVKTNRDQKDQQRVGTLLYPNGPAQQWVWSRSHLWSATVWRWNETEWLWTLLWTHCC